MGGAEARGRVIVGQVLVPLVPPIGYFADFLTPGKASTD